MAALGLYSILSIIFISFFVILNSRNLILYSFPLFLILSLIIAYRGELVKYLISASLIMIISATLLYTGIISDYTLIYASATIIILPILFTVYKGKWRAFNGVMAIALLLPILLYLAKFNTSSAYEDNIAIVGYYILISIVIGMFIRLIDSDTLKRIGSRIRKFERSNRRALVYGFIVLGVVLIIAPIWPSRFNPINNTLYVKVNLSESLNGSAYYSINFSPYNYSNIVNNNLTNIMFGYENGVPIDSYISNSSHFSNHSIRILLRGSNHTEQNSNHIYMYLLPVNTTSTHMIVLNSSDFANITAEPLNATFGKVSGNPAITNGSMPYYVYREMSSSYSETVSMDPYTAQLPICPQGSPTRSNISFSSDVPISAFIVYNQSKFDNATLVSRNEEISYAFYMRALKSSSTYRIIDSDKGVLTDINTSQSCASLYILANSTADVNVSIYNRFTFPVRMNRPIEYYKEQARTERPWFLPSALLYLSSVYSNYT